MSKERQEDSGEGRESSELQVDDILEMTEKEQTGRG